MPGRDTPVLHPPKRVPGMGRVASGASDDHRGSQSTDSGRQTTAPAARFYDRIAAAYELVADAAEHQARKCGLELLRVGRADHVLELGAGTGRALLSLARCAVRGRVCGLDISQGMLRLAHERTLPYADRTHLVLGDARRLPYRDASFDAVFTSFLLELFEPAKVRCVLSEAARVLRADGRLAAVALAATEHQGLRSTAYAWLHRRFPRCIDCGPIDLPGILKAGGFQLADAREFTLFGLPAMAVLAQW